MSEDDELTVDCPYCGTPRDPTESPCCHGAEADLLRVEVDDYRVALGVALRAMIRRLHEDAAPAYYGPGSEWEQMQDAVDAVTAVLDLHEEAA